MKIQVYILTLEDVPNMLKKGYKLVNIAIFLRGNNYHEVRHGAKHFVNIISFNIYRSLIEVYGIIVSFFIDEESEDQQS